MTNIVDAAVADMDTTIIMTTKAVAADMDMTIIMITRVAAVDMDMTIIMTTKDAAVDTDMTIIMTMKAAVAADMRCRMKMWQSCLICWITTNIMHWNSRKSLHT